MDIIFLSKMNLVFNLEHLCQFFIKFNKQGQFWNLLVMWMPKLFLIVESNEELEIFKVKDKA